MSLFFGCDTQGVKILALFHLHEMLILTSKLNSAVVLQ
uniref:Uncharacterized protein n=1 Tax=Arundo donax TaxID=35708 RepID=A0A0A8XV37_ARUDO